MAFVWRELTPAGVAPVRVLRLEGDCTGLRLRDAAGELRALPGPDRVLHAWIHDDGGPLEDSLVLRLQGGVELHLHGGLALRERARRWIEEAGGKELLVDAGVAAATEAPTSWRAVRAALSCRNGPLARLCDRLESGAPVSDDDAWRVQRALALRRFAAVLRRPPVIALVGPPNTGKSTLFNSVLGQARAVTSAAAGTTRDSVEEPLLLRGVPVRLRDTAGGEEGRKAGATADLVVRFLSLPTKPAPPSPSGAAERLVLGRADLQAHVSRPGMLAVSGRTGLGITRLTELLADDLGIPRNLEADIWAPWSSGLERRLSRWEATRSEGDGAAPRARDLDPG